jgi:uncharacterized protein
MNKPKFDRDRNKAKSNLQKHGVSFDEAEKVFDDPMVCHRYDEAHSEVEHRWFAVGFSNKGRLLVVSYTQRGEKCRIISARKAGRIHKEAYEDENR